DLRTPTPTPAPSPPPSRAGRSRRRGGRSPPGPPSPDSADLLQPDRSPSDAWGMTTTILLSQFSILRCVHPVPQANGPQPRGPFVTIQFADGLGLMSMSIYEKGARYSPGRI